MGRAFNLACEVPWLITEEGLRLILSIAARENESVEAVAAKLGKPLDGARSAHVRDDHGRPVAVIPIEGPIFRHANLFTEVSGGVTTAQLACDLRVALDNPDIAGIVFEIDSPGGEAAGIAELARTIRSASARKPVVAYADGSAASAAYWLGVAAPVVIASPTALLGSIGAVMAVRDPTKTSSSTIIIKSSQSPDKHPDPTTDRGRATIQTMVDALAQVFVEEVAAHRGVTAADVLLRFGQGGLRVGQQAVEAGMADRVGLFEDVVRDLGHGRFAVSPSPRPVAAESRPRTTRSINMGWLDNILKASGGRGVVVALPDDDQGDDEGQSDGHQSAESPPPGRREAAGQSGTTATEEMTRLRAENERLQAERQVAAAAEREATLREIVTTAHAFANGLVNERRVLPKDRSHVAAQHMQAALDDRGLTDTVAVVAGDRATLVLRSEATPSRPSRVQALEARYAAVAQHPYTREYLRAMGAEALPTDREGATADAAKAADRERLREQARARYGPPNGRPV